jgi:hypothetical protein
MPVQIPCSCMMQPAVSLRERTAAWRPYDQAHLSGPTPSNVRTRSKGKPLLSGWAATSHILSSDQICVSHPWRSCAFAKLSATVPTPVERRLTLEQRCMAVSILVLNKHARVASVFRERSKLLRRGSPSRSRRSSLGCIRLPVQPHSPPSRANRHAASPLTFPMSEQTRRRIK